MELRQQTTEDQTSPVDTLKRFARRVIGVVATGVAVGMAVVSAFEVIDFGSDDWDSNSIDPLASKD